MGNVEYSRVCRVLNGFVDVVLTLKTNRLDIDTSSCRFARRSMGSHFLPRAGAGICRTVGTFKFSASHLVRSFEKLLGSAARLDGESTGDE